MEVMAGLARKEEGTYRHLKTRSVCILGVAAKEGQGEEGPELAPNAMRDANLLKVIEKLGWETRDCGDLTHENGEEMDSKYGKKATDLNRCQKNGDGTSTCHSEDEEHKSSSDMKVVKKVEVRHSVEIGKMCHVLSNVVETQAKAGRFCLTLGGDHGIATGSIHGLLQAYPNLRVIWVDAHGDINTPESSPSGNYHGMPAAHVTGLFSNIDGFEWLAKTLPIERLVFIGLRDIDDREKKIIRDNKVKYFDMHQIDRWGIGEIMERVLKYLDEKNEGHPIHVSWDIDSVDPAFALGTGTKARGGLTYREAHYIMRRVAESGNVVGLDLVEVNPVLDPPGSREALHGDDPVIKGSETVCLGVELIKSILGHTLV